MKNLPLKSALALSATAFSLCILSTPVFAAESPDTTPPTIGLASPQTFDVNHLTLIQADVKDESGLNGCNLFVNAKDVGAMRLMDGKVSMTQVFMTPETRRIQIRCADQLNNVGLSPVMNMQANTPDATVAGMLPVGFTKGMLLRLSCGPEEMNAEHCQNIYYVGTDAKRHAFQSLAAFNSWYPNGGSFISVSLAAMASLPLGQSISVKPGQSAIRFLSQPTVYAVGAKKILRAFASTTLLTETLGNNWNANVEVLTDAFYENFSFGPEIRTKAEATSNVSTPDEIL